GSLRKAEYITLIKDLGGAVPAATPAFFYRACLEMLSQFPIENVQKAYCNVLKNRINKQTNHYLSDGVIPHYMNYSFYQFNSNKSSYLTLINNLRKNLL